MPRSYLEKYQSVDAVALASDVGGAALSLAAELESANEEDQQKLIAEKGLSLAANIFKLIEVSAVHLVEDVKNRETIPPIFTELSYLSLGYSEEEAAKQRDLTKFTVKSRRKEIKAYLGSRTRNDMVAEAIQRGLVYIEPDNQDYKRLSWMEDRVLAFAAAGWTTKEIAEYFVISNNTTDRHYEEIRTKLGARNMPHAVRRAFELGIFKIGEPLGVESEVTKRLTIVFADTSGNDVSLDIEDPREIDFLKKMVRVGSGGITAQQAVEAEGLFEVGKMPHVGRTVLGLAEKLEKAIGTPVLIKSRIRENGQRSHIYHLSTELTLNDGGVLVIIPKFNPPNAPAKNRRLVKNNPAQSPRQKRVRMVKPTPPPVQAKAHTEIVLPEISEEKQTPKPAEDLTHSEAPTETLQTPPPMELSEKRLTRDYPVKNPPIAASPKEEAPLVPPDAPEAVKQMVMYLMGESTVSPQDFTTHDLRKSWSIVNNAKGRPKDWQTKFAQIQRSKS